MGLQTVTPAGEACFTFVFRPQKNNLDASKEDQYSLTLLWDKNDPKLKKLKRAIEDVAIEEFGDKAVAMLKKGQLNSPLRDGEDKEGTKLEDLFEGKMFMTAKSTDKPEIVDEEAEPVMQQSDFYSGCIARMDVWLYAYNKKGNRGVAAILNSAQKLDEGERKSGRRSAWEAFGKDSDDDEDRPPSRNGKNRHRRNEDDDDDKPAARGRSRSRRDEDDEDDDPPPRRGRTGSGRRSSSILD